MIYNRAQVAREVNVKGARLHEPSEAELVAALYCSYGIRGVEKMRGVFSYALVDRDQETCYLVRDRLGVKPLYYAIEPESATFGARAADVFELSGVEPEINLRALPHFLFGVMRSPETIFAGILTVPPGHYVTVGRNGVDVHEYWDVPFPENGTHPVRSAEDCADELDALLSEAVQLPPRDDEHPMGLLLSGGLDSSLLARLTRGQELSTFTVAINVPPHESDESEYARLVAEHVGSHHTQLDYGSEDVNAYFLDTLRRFECPMYPGDIEIFIPIYLLHKRIHEDGIDSVLCGIGSDEIFGGYQYHEIEKLRLSGAADPEQASAADDPFRAVTGRRGEDRSFFRRVHDEILRTYGHNLASMVWIKDFAFVRDNLTNLLSDEVLSVLDSTELAGLVPLGIAADRYQRFHPFDQVLYLDLKTRLADSPLLAEHQISQSFGMDAHLPYLDHRVVEFAATVPPDVKMRGLTYKYLVSEVARRYLPSTFFRRDFRGFTPFEREVFMSPESFLVNELLSRSALAHAGYLKPDFVQELLQRYPQESDHATKAAIYFLLQRCLIIQGIHHLFVRKAGLKAKLAARLTGVREQLLLETRRRPRDSSAG